MGGGRFWTTNNFKVPSAYLSRATLYSRARIAIFRLAVVRLTSADRLPHIALAPQLFGGLRGCLNGGSRCSARDFIDNHGNRKVMAGVDFLNERLKQPRIHQNRPCLMTSRLLFLVLVCSLCAPITESLLHNLPILFDSSNSLHRSIQYHPEQPQRIEVCVQTLDNYKLHIDPRLDLVDVATEPTPHFADTCMHQPFTQEELNHARDMLVQVHSEELVTGLERKCYDSRLRRVEEGKASLGFVGYIDDDTYVTTESYDVCLRATATWIRAVDMAVSDEEGNHPAAAAAMALTRPPGHHATATLSNGFCIFNFCAAAAQHALRRNPNLKISILDWDVHYGQGVADFCMKHAQTRYVSIHQTPAFPYLGESRSRIGAYKNVLTVPILADTTWKCGYQECFQRHALPFLSEKDEWEPDLLIVCAGYDALDSDDLASVSLTAADYGKMTRMLLQHVQTHTHTSRPSIVAGLEGGYQLAKGVAGGNLADAVLETVQALLDG